MTIPIIVGYRRKTKLIASFPLDCPQCGQETLHVYGQVSENPTLFFIPIPIGSCWAFVQCSECGLGQRVSEDKEEEIRSLAKYGAPPFRICPNCVAHNDLDATFCRVCDKPLKRLLFPRKPGARIVAILLTALFALLFVAMCYSCYVESF